MPRQVRITSQPEAPPPPPSPPPPSPPPAPPPLGRLVASEAYALPQHEVSGATVFSCEPLRALLSVPWLFPAILFVLLAAGQVCHWTAHSAYLSATPTVRNVTMGLSVAAHFAAFLVVVGALNPRVYALVLRSFDYWYLCASWVLCTILCAADGILSPHVNTLLPILHGIVFGVLGFAIYGVDAWTDRAGGGQAFRAGFGFTLSAFWVWEAIAWALIRDSRDDVLDLRVFRSTFGGVGGALCLNNAVFTLRWAIQHATTLHCVALAKVPVVLMPPDEFAVFALAQLADSGSHNHDASPPGVNVLNAVGFLGGSTTIDEAVRQLRGGAPAPHQASTRVALEDSAAGGSPIRPSSRPSFLDEDDLERWVDGYSAAPPPPGLGRRFAVDITNVAYT